MAYATTDDVADRLGRDLTEPEERQASYLLDGATATINYVAGIPPGPELTDPPPEMIKFIAVELAIRVLSNPAGVTRYTESLGAYSYAPTFSEGGVGQTVTPIEAGLINDVIYGTPYSARLPSMIDDVIDYRDNLEIDRSWPVAATPSGS